MCLDYQPRELNEQQQTALSTLAAQVMAQLELRRMITERDEAVAANGPGFGLFSL